mmetsp:Transcript_2836/g.4087  ORF Transcript_2836/g.4087 Transcript_2836/m.4087 type:complete len:158 (-) Transcript_2836:57-530(-)
MKNNEEVNQDEFDPKQIEEFERVFNSVGGIDENGMLNIKHLGTVMRLCGATIIDQDIQDYETHIAKPVFSFFDLLDILSMHFRSEPTDWEEYLLQFFALMDVEQTGRISIDRFQMILGQGDSLVTYRDIQTVLGEFLSRGIETLTLTDYMQIMTKTY